jgi:threonyl-tRNA synthetase
VFYAPKIDIKVHDAIGREWQGATVQIDLNLPERFDVTYANEHGQRERAVMIHRVLFGSLERFVGGLIEHYAGALPVWLSPVQVVVIPIGDMVQAYAEHVAQTLRARGLRVEMDERNEKMQAKIRDAQLRQIPYMAVLGGREVSAKTVAVRHRRQGDLGTMGVEAFAARVQQEDVGRATT